VLVLVVLRLSTISPLPSKPLVYGAFRIRRPFTLEIISRYHGGSGAPTGYPDGNPLSGLISLSQGLFIVYGGLGEPQFMEIGRIGGEGIDLRVVEAVKPTLEDARLFLAMNNMSLDPPSSFEEIIDHYSRLGWEYMVLGKTVLDNNSVIVTYYLFRTDKIVYPLYVDKLAPGQTMVSLTIISEDPLSPGDLGVDEGYDVDLDMETVLRNAMLRFIGDPLDAQHFYHIISNASKYMGTVIPEAYVLDGRCNGLLYTVEYGSIPTEKLVGDFIAYPGEDEYSVYYNLRTYSLKPVLTIGPPKYSPVLLPNPFTIPLSIAMIYTINYLFKPRRNPILINDLLKVNIVLYILPLVIGLAYISSIPGSPLTLYLP